MSKKQKYYVVWFGNPTGIFDSWKKCQASIKGIAGAQYMSFETLKEANVAYNKDYKDYVGTKKNTKKTLSAAEKAKFGEPNLYSIAVDAASSGNPGIMEYRGVVTQTKKQLFHQGPFQQGTNNVGEFLALVHGLAFLKQKNSDLLLYSDSRIAIGWVRKKKCNTKLKQTAKNKAVFDLISRAETWLKTNAYPTKVVKWETKAWGEIPADFGRK
ncbi:viroplasmin family protein [Patiriisocius sp. Uisw_017]|jgi:ribonuclease HI|uniref:ribonuclease H1 domain-containing protein n=1 Tax=Patiriisocius sp. Uisw_017 TaxID=3230968 RepID=UPI0039EBD589